MRRRVQWIENGIFAKNFYRLHVNYFKFIFELYCVIIAGYDQIEDALSNGAIPEMIGSLLQGNFLVPRISAISLFCVVFAGV